MYGPKHAYKDSVKKKTICKNAFRITVRDRQATKWRTSLEKFYGKGGCDCKISAYFQFQDHRVTRFSYKFEYLVHYHIFRKSKVGIRIEYFFYINNKSYHITDIMLRVIYFYTDISLPLPKIKLFVDIYTHVLCIFLTKVSRVR